MKSVKVIACPHCQQVWKCPDQAKRVRCGDCQHTFDVSQAPSVMMPGEMWDELASQPEGQATLTAEQQAQMQSLAQNFADFDSRVTAQPQDEPVEPVVVRSRGWGALFVAAFIVASPFALALMHQPILQAAPAARPLMEKFCGLIDCPGFAWQTPKAIRSSIRLGEVDKTEEGWKAHVDIDLTNTSEHPQYYPAMTLTVLDNANNVLATRYLDREDFSPAGAVLKAGDTQHLNMVLELPVTNAPAALKLNEDKDIDLAP